MILKKIEIENVKTHKKTTIPFQKGLNVFYGENGTGKSTILEMIGFVIFDYLPARKHDVYIREVHGDKPEFGIIKLWIIGYNNEPYIIERTIGKPNVIIYNALTNKELKQISDITKFKKWIRAQLGVTDNIALDKLFKTSIGIPQGTFINPFRRAPSERKKYFDPILNLNIYENMFLKLKQTINKVYFPQLKEIENRISEKSGEIKNKAEVLEKKNDLANDVNDLNKELDKIKIIHEDLKLKLDKLNELKENLRSTIEEFEKVSLQKKNISDSITGLQLELDDAKKANNQCKKSKSNSNKYSQLLNEQGNLQIKLANLQSEQKKLGDLTQNCVRLNVQRDIIYNNMREAEQAEIRAKELETYVDKYNRLDEDFKSKEEKTNILTNLEQSLNDKLKQLNDKSNEIERIQEKLTELPKLKKKHEGLILLEEEKTRLELSVVKLNSEINRLIQDQETLEKGICPIFEQKCLNLKEKIASIDGLIKKVKDQKKLLKDSEKNLASIKEQLKIKEDLSGKIQKLHDLEISLNEHQKFLSSLQKEYDKEKAKTENLMPLIEQKKVIRQEINRLEPYIEEYRKNNDKAENLDSNKVELKAIENNLQEAEKKKQEQENIVKKLEPIPEKLKKIRLEMKPLKEDYESYQSNKLLAQTLPKKEEEVNKATNRLKRLENELEISKRKLDNFAKDYDEKTHSKTETEVKEIETTITTLKTKIDAKKERLKDITADLSKITQLEKELENFNQEKDKIEVQLLFIKKLRIWLREFVPKMRKALIHQINIAASDIYRNLREEDDAMLLWQEDYDIIISNSKSTKSFFRLSGGEKMSAALAIRLAILKVLTKANFAFFDEPTTNLDEGTRRNLSKYIYNIKGFDQLFVISHDDSFKRHSEYIVKFTKDENEITHVEYLTNN
jgi:DNA repair protein SbcC/Rad50